MTIPETPLQDSNGFQLVTNRKRRRQILQTLVAEDNDPIPDENDVFSDSDGRNIYTVGMNYGLQFLKAIFKKRWIAWFA